MTDEKKITKGLDKELMQLIDVEMNDPVIGKLLNRNAAYVLGKEIKILFIDKACDWLRTELDKEEELHYIHVHGFDKERREIFLEELKKAMKEQIRDLKGD